MNMLIILIIDTDNALLMNIFGPISHHGWMGGVIDTCKSSNPLNQLPFLSMSEELLVLVGFVMRLCSSQSRIQNCARDASLPRGMTCWPIQSGFDSQECLLYLCFPQCSIGVLTTRHGGVKSRVTVDGVVVVARIAPFLLTRNPAVTIRPRTYSSDPHSSPQIRTVWWSFSRNAEQITSTFANSFLT